MPAKPELYVRPGTDLHLSGPAMMEFLEAVLARGLPFRFRARGLSMHPFIKDGDVVTVSPLAGRALVAGDVAACLHPDNVKLILHRIVAAQPGGYLFRGNSAAEADGLIPPAQVLGRVSRLERDGRVVRLGLGPERRLLAWLSRKTLEASLGPLGHPSKQTFIPGEKNDEEIRFPDLPDSHDNGR